MNENQERQQVTIAADRNESERLSRLSNGLASISYAEEYLTLLADTNGLDTNDLAACTVNGIDFPALRNGANAYSERSKTSLVLDEKRFREQDLFSTDAFVVIPEIAFLCSNSLTSPWPVRTAIESVVAALSDTLARTTVFAQPAISPDSDPYSYVRLFDSHLSVLAYVDIVYDLLAKLGHGGTHFTVDIEMRRYLCDLASRFSKRRTFSAFPVERHLKFERRAPDSLRGLFRRYENSSAPLQRRLLLIGDAHSYSALAQIFSYVFLSVDFFWDTREDAYPKTRDAILELRKNADVVVEEAAERFFLRNFCTSRA